MQGLGGIEPEAGMSQPAGPEGPAGLGGMGSKFDLKMGEVVGEGGIQNIITPNDYALELYLREGYTTWNENGTYYSVTTQSSGSNSQWVSLSTYQQDSNGNKYNVQNYPNAYYVTAVPKTPDPYHTRYEVFTGPNQTPAPYLDFDKLVSVPNNLPDIEKYMPGFQKELLMQMCLQIMNQLKQAQAQYKQSLQDENS